MVVGIGLEKEKKLNWNEERLNQLLVEPSPGLIEDMKKIKGDIMILGAGGKMGPSLAVLAAKAARGAGVNKKIWAVSRFSDEVGRRFLEENGVTTISLDLMADGALEQLPDAANLIYMAGKKFGTNGNESETWKMNVSLPTLVTRRFSGGNIVVFSSGNIYPQVPICSGGCADWEKPVPVGEYAMSTLGRERVFEAASKDGKTKVLLYRLNYAVDLRYGVLYDLAQKVLKDEIIDLTSGNFNCVWQGYANEAAIRGLLHAESPAAVLNVTGPETVSVRYVAGEFGKLFGKEPKLTGAEEDKAYLNNAARCFELFGYPAVTLRQMIKWQAEWLLSGGRVLNIPTHFEEKGGSY